MEPIPFKITEKNDASFQVQVHSHGHYYEKLHYHPEYQLSLILNGEGISSVGGQIDRFQHDDIYLIGPNVPHVFQLDAHPGNARAQIINLFFRDSSFGQHFFLLPEMGGVKCLLEESLQGIKLSGALCSDLKPMILELLELSGVVRLVKLLLILHHMAVSSERRLLSYVRREWPTRKEIYQRLNRVFQYIYDNFDRPISLDEVAEVANLSRYAFCRYFKRSTHKSFINYLNEFRIGMACRFLQRRSDSITQVGLNCGFNNLSNFNRQFKRIMNCTPSEYREQLQLLG